MWYSRPFIPAPSVKLDYPCRSYDVHGVSTAEKKGYIDNWLYADFYIIISTMYKYKTRQYGFDIQKQINST